MEIGGYADAEELPAQVRGLVPIISTAHKKVNYTELFEWVPLIVDTRNAMKSIDPKLIKTIKC